MRYTTRLPAANIYKYCQKPITDTQYSFKYDIKHLLIKQYQGYIYHSIAINAPQDNEHNKDRFFSIRLLSLR